MRAKRSGNELLFQCPGCGPSAVHLVPVEGPKAWGFNGSLERPTLTPSVLVRGKDYDEDPDGKPCNVRDRVCHSFVTDGRIQYLGDCTHALAGQTVDLPEVTEP